MGTRLLRRLAVVALGAAPVALVVGSWASDGDWHRFPRLAFGLAAAALLVALFNFWLSFGRPRYLRWRHPEARLRNISGIPVVGSVLAALAGLTGFGGPAAPIVALLALALDTGGLPWFVVATWRDETLWAPR
jgi:hypothetical protein